VISCKLFLSDFERREEGQYKPKTTGALAFLVCGRVSSPSFVQRNLAEMALSGEEGVGTRAQLASN